MAKYSLIFLVLLSGCVTYDKCIDKFGTITTDTTYVVDTIQVNIQGDTIRAAFSDTVHYLERETERTKLIYRQTVDSVYIHCEAKPDTIYKEIETPIITERVVLVDNTKPWYFWLLMGLVAAAVLYFGLKFIINKYL